MSNLGAQITRFTSKYAGYITFLWFAVCALIVFIATFSQQYLPSLTDIVALPLRTVCLFWLFVACSQYRLLFIPVLLLVGADTVIRLTYEAPMSLSVWFSVLNAPIEEITAFLSQHSLILIFAIPLACLILFVPTPKVTQKQKRALTAFSGLALILYGTLTYTAEEYRQFKVNRLALGTRPLQISVEYAFKKTGHLLPPVESFLGLVQTASYALRYTSTSTQSWTDVKSTSSSPDVAVIVLGESIRGDHLGVYGYQRPTTPHLTEHRTSTTILKRAYSAGTNTWNALPAILTKYESLGTPDLSIITLAQSAGYKVHWLSNQAPNDVWGLAVNHIARAADTAQYISKGKATPPYDEALLPFLKDILHNKKAGEKHLVVLHLYASHSLFSRRYPPHFQKFRGAKANKKNAMINAYDNSILYVDHILNEVRTALRPLGGNILFFADHGLTAANSKKPLIHDVRANPDIQSLHVPLTVEGSNRALFDENKTYSLYYFECLFANWLGLTAKELTDDNYCNVALQRKEITYITAEHERREERP